MAKNKQLGLPGVEKAEKPEAPKDMSMSAFVGDETADEENAPAQTSLSVYSDKPMFDSSDVTPTMIRLAQGLTPEVQSGDAKPGQWIIPGFDPFDSVTVVPWLFAKRREYRDDEGTMLCISDNSIEGVGDPGGPCEDCVMNKWAGERGKRRPPACTFMYAYVVFVVETGSPALLYFKRTSIGIGRMMNAMVAQGGMRKTVIRLTSKGQKGKKGSYYTPMIAPITGESAAAAIEAAAAKVG
jgi:hypothetical protein